MKTVTIKELKSIKLQNSNDYVKERIQNQEIYTKMVNQFWPCETVIHISEQDGKDYFENTSTRLEHPKINFEMTKFGNHHTVQYRKYFQNTDRYDNTTEAKPNNIGKLTTKKIGEWISYYERLHAHLKKISIERTTIKETLVAKIMELKKKGYKVTDHGSRYYIVKNGLEYSVSLSESIPREEIKIYGVEDTLDNFILMSNNKL